MTDRVSNPDAAVDIPPKVCACGRSYDARAFAALPFVGVQAFDDEWAAELRQCPCLSTIAIPVPAEPLT